MPGSERVSIYLTVQVACWLPAHVQLDQICVQYDRTRRYLVHGNRAGPTSINRLYRTVQTYPVAQLVHRDIDIARAIKDKEVEEINLRPIKFTKLDQGQ